MIPTESPFAPPPAEQQSTIGLQHAHEREVKRAWTCGVAFGLIAGLVMSTELWGFLTTLFGK